MLKTVHFSLQIVVYDEKMLHLVKNLPTYTFW